MTLVRRVVCCCALGGATLALAPLDANAADDPTAPPPQTVVVQQVGAQPVYVQPVTQPVYVQQPQPVYVVRQPGYLDEDRGRFRFGLTFGGGYMTIATDLGSFTGGHFLGEVRAGWQFNRLFGLYYQPGIIIGGGGGSTTAGSGWGGIAVQENNSVLAELTLGNIFQLAAGPSFDWIASAIESVNTVSPGASVYVGGGGAFGFDARIAATFNRGFFGRRRGFSISANLHSDFVPHGIYLYSSLGLGYEWY
jgi:hypothetical protein